MAMACAVSPTMMGQIAVGDSSNEPGVADAGPGVGDVVAKLLHSLRPGGPSLPGPSRSSSPAATSRRVLRACAARAAPTSSSLPPSLQAKIRQVLSEPEPRPYVRGRPHCPKLGRFHGVLDQILVDDEKAPPEQRHTAMQGATARRGGVYPLPLDARCVTHLCRTGGRGSTPPLRSRFSSLVHSPVSLIAHH